MPQNLVPAKRGRFQTRLSRLVDILSSKVIQVPVPGEPGKTVPRTIWLGQLYASNGKTPEGQFEWEDSGAFRNQRGVASPNDLAIYVGRFPGQVDDPEAATENQVDLENTARHTELVAQMEAPAPAPAPYEVDERLKPFITGLIVDLYDYLLTVAAENGLDVQGRGAMIRGPWMEAVNETLVALMDTPAPARQDPPPPPPPPPAAEVVKPGDGIQRDPSEAA